MGNTNQEGFRIPRFYNLFPFTLETGPRLCKYVPLEKGESSPHIANLCSRILVKDPSVMKIILNSKLHLNYYRLSGKGQRFLFIKVLTLQLLGLLNDFLIL